RLKGGTGSPQVSATTVSRRRHGQYHGTSGCGITVGGDRDLHRDGNGAGAGELSREGLRSPDAQNLGWQRPALGSDQMMSPCAVMAEKCARQIWVWKLRNTCFVALITWQATRRA